MTAQPSSQAEREDVALLPCPFCGAAATWREDDPARFYEPIGLIVDHARDCFLRGVVNFDKASITGTWNTRPARENADDRAPALVEAAVAEMRERAAKVADVEERSGINAFREETTADMRAYRRGRAEAGQCIALAIRALGTPSQEASNVG